MNDLPKLNPVIFLARTTKKTSIWSFGWWKRPKSRFFGHSAAAKWQKDVCLVVRLAETTKNAVKSSSLNGGTAKRRFFDGFYPDEPPNRRKPPQAGSAILPLLVTGLPPGDKIASRHRRLCLALIGPRGSARTQQLPRATADHILGRDVPAASALSGGNTTADGSKTFDNTSPKPTLQLMPTNPNSQNSTSAHFWLATC